LKVVNYIEDLFILEDHSTESAVYATEDPAVYEFLNKNNVDVFIPSSLLAQDEINAGAKYGAQLALSWVNEINKYFIDHNNYGIGIGTVINTNLYNYIASAVFKYQCLSVLKEKSFQTKIFCHAADSRVNTKTINERSLLLDLVSLNEFKECFSEVNLADVKDRDHKGYSVVSKFSVLNIPYYLLGLLAEPTKLEFYKNKRKLKKLNISDINEVDMRSKSILILRLSPQIEINFSNWIDEGCNVYLCNIKTQKEVSNKTDLRMLQKKMMGNLLNYQDVDLSADFLKFICKNICSYLSDIVLPIHDNIRDQLRGVDCHNMRIITGGRDIEGSLFSALMSNLGVPTIVFQEGTSCMHEFYRYLVSLGYITQGDAFVSRSLHEERYYNKITNDYWKRFLCYGGSAIQYSKYPMFSRFISRTLWGIKYSDDIVLYVPTRFHGKTIRPYKTFTDMQYWSYQKRLANNVFSRVNKQIFIKKHKKGLVSTDDTRISPFSIIGVSDNVELKEQPDLRFCRFAADIILVDMATSTLSWALTSNKPVVFMHSKLSPLQGEVYRSAKKALFIVDVDDDLKWQDDLKKLLNKSVSEINERWRTMKEDRDLFMKEYVTGTGCTGKEMYRWMLAI